MTFRNFLMSAVLGFTSLLPAVSKAGTVFWPCSGTVTSPYGPRSSPCSGCSTFHHGIDIGVGTGTDLGAPWNGTVTSYAFDSCGGNIMKIGFGGGWESRFLHCSARVAAVGAGVARNQHVAESGGTGSCTTGPHLHFEMRKDGVSQSIPGSSGTWVTRNTAIPKDFPGCGEVPPPPPPPTSPITNLAGWYRIITQFGNKVFDVQDASLADGGNIQQYGWNGGAHQVWLFEHLGNGYYKITSKNSGKVMDVAGPSTADGANIHQWAWNGTDNQQWRVEDVGNGNVRLVAKHSGKVADVAGSGTTDGTNIHQWTWNGGNAQRFRLESVPVPITTLAGEYRMIRKATDNKAVDLDNQQLQDGANIHLWDTNAGDAQVWNFELQADGYYKISARASGKVIDVAGPSTADGADIHQWTWSGTDNQRWSVQDLGDGYRRLVAKHSGKVLESSGLTAIDNGTNIQQWSWHGAENQRWNIEAVGAPVTNLTGGFNILCKLNGVAVDVQNAGTADGANIWAWPPNGGVAQQFTFDHLGAGFYRINCVCSGKVIDVAGPSVANGANIHQWSWLGGANQRWRIELMADGFYRLLSQHSGKAMDVASAVQGGEIHQWAWHGGDNQRFSLNPISAAPAAPSGLAAAAVSNSQINLTWTDNSANETNFVVKRSTTTGGPYTNIATLGANVTSYNNTGLAGNTTYYYVVEATSFGGNSGNSNQASATTLNNPPAAPSGLAASSPSTSQVNLTWTDNSNDETNFIVGRSSTSGGPYSDIATLGANVTSYSNTGLTANTTYYYVVRATNAAGASANAGQASATTWPNEIVVDNSGTFTASANWTTGTSAADKFGSDYRFRPTAAVSDQAVWNITVPQTRNYQISAWWAAGTNRAAAAPYTLTDNTATNVNQQTGGGAWNGLGVKSVAAGAATVKLSCWTTTGFVVVADAVKLAPQ